MSQRYERYWGRKSNGKLNDFALKWPRLRQYIPRKKGVTVMDFGCGNGEIIKEMMALNPSAKYIGLDVSDTALSTATANIPEARFHQIFDGGRFPLQDNSIDFVFTSEVIEHIYDVENAFLEIARVLKSDGQLLLTTPYHGFIKNLLIACFLFEKHFNPEEAHIRFFTKKTLFSSLRKRGLEPSRYGYYGRVYPIPRSIFVFAKKDVNLNKVASFTPGGNDVE